MIYLGTIGLSICLMPIMKIPFAFKPLFGTYQEHSCLGCQATSPMLQIDNPNQRSV